MLKILNLLAGLLIVGGLATAASAGTMVYHFTFERDGHLTDSPFGSLVVTKGQPEDSLQFTIDIDKSKLGQNADIRMFGFQIHGFAGELSLSPLSISSENITLSTGPTNATKVNGMGNTQFDYLVHFGNGNPTINPVTFLLTGSTSFGFDNLVASDAVSIYPDELEKVSNGKKAMLLMAVAKPDNLANFAVHVQSTSPNDPGSETLGGLWNARPSGSIVPEPASLVLWTVLGATFSSFCRRRMT